MFTKKVPEVYLADVADVEIFINFIYKWIATKNCWDLIDISPRSYMHHHLILELRPQFFIEETAFFLLKSFLLRLRLRFLRLKKVNLNRSFLHLEGRYKHLYIYTFIHIHIH